MYGQRLGRMIRTSLVVLLAIGVAGYSSELVGALSTSYFDRVNDFENTAAIGEPTYPVVNMIGSTSYFYGTTHLRAYFTTSSGRVIIEDKDFCAGTTNDFQQSGTPAPAMGTAVTRFTFTYGGSTSVYNGVKAGSCPDVTYSFSGLTQETGTGLYFVDIAAVPLISNSVNGVTVTATGAGAMYVAQVGGTSGHEVTLQERGAPYYNHDYYIRFGSDCSVSANTTKQISLYDVDNNGGAGAQLNGQVWLELYEWVDGSSTPVRIPLSGPGGTNVLAYTPPSLDNAVQTVSFTAKPRSKYSLHLNNVYGYNVVQVSTPFNGIFAEVSCPAAQWTIDGSTTVTANGVTGTNLNVEPGASVTFRHYLKNNGPNQATGIAWGTDVSIGTSGTGTAATIASGAQPNVYTQTVTVPSTATAGQTFCQRIHYNPSGANPAVGLENGAYACVRVVYNYTLIPQVTSTSVTVPPGGTAIFNLSVQNAGPTQSNPTSVLVREIIIPPNVTPTSGYGQHDDASCAIYGGASSCIDTALPSQTFPVGTTPLGSVTITAGVHPVGTQICRVLSVDSRDASPPPHNRDSAVKCVIVSSQPSLAMVGADASAGGVIEGVAMAGGAYGFRGTDSFTQGFGSFGEYGLFATGPIENFASAGTASLLSMQYLMFANPSVAPPRSAGYFTSSHIIPNYEEAFKARGLAGNTSLGGFGSSSKDYNVTSDVTLPATAIAAGRKILVYAPGKTVTIGGNITTASNVGTFANAATVMIIAGNIVIAPTVTQVDAVLFASGAVTTCSAAGLNTAAVIANKAALIAGGACNQQPLRVNGAIISRSLVTARTAGGLKSTDTPSDLVRLRPEAFLTPFEGGTSSNLVTDSETELPPRN